MEYERCPGDLTIETASARLISRLSVARLSSARFKVSGRQVIQVVLGTIVRDAQELEGVAALIFDEERPSVGIMHLYLRSPATGDFIDDSIILDRELDRNLSRHVLPGFFGAVSFQSRGVLVQRFSDMKVSLDDILPALWYTAAIFISFRGRHRQAAIVAVEFSDMMSKIIGLLSKPIERVVRFFTIPKTKVTSSILIPIIHPRTGEVERHVSSSTALDEGISVAMRYAKTA